MRIFGKKDNRSEEIVRTHAGFIAALRDRDDSDRNALAERVAMEMLVSAVIIHHQDELDAMSVGVGRWIRQRAEQWIGEWASVAAGRT